MLKLLADKLGSFDQVRVTKSTIRTRFFISSWSKVPIICFKRSPRELLSFVQMRTYTISIVTDCSPFI